MKKIRALFNAPQSHWVGDGFPVRTLFAYDQLGQQLSPFLLLDHAGPYDFPASEQRRGVGQHPHRGFETVTIVYQGELEHRDSSGGGGTIGPGDVQWMTAGGGILHEEFHTPAFSRSGGTLHMAQLWVNLPARDKMVDAAYQTLLAASIPQVSLPNQAGQLRVIAGQYGGQHGPAHTFSPLDVWDLQLAPGKPFELHLREQRNTALVVLQGCLRVNGETLLSSGQLALLDADGDRLPLEAEADSLVLLLSGEALNEPIVGHGPFVMNNQAEIIQAMDDYRRGQFGQIGKH